MNTKNTFLLILLTVAMTMAAPAKEKMTIGSHSETYPQSPDKWQESLLAGNGKTGIMVFGNPLHETIILNDRRFNLPGQGNRQFAEVHPDTIATIRRLCAEGRFREANDMAVRTSQWHDGGEGSRHPGYQLNIDIAPSGPVDNYRRETNYQTGEVTVSWTDSRGRWERRAFVSRADDVAVVSLTAPSGALLDCDLSLHLPDALGMPEGTKASLKSALDYLGICVNYAAPRSDVGYEGAARVCLKGGTASLSGDTLNVKGARSVVVLIKNNKFYADCDREFALGTTRKALRQLTPDYGKLLKAHARIHSAIFNRVKIDLGATAEDRALSNEALLQRQRDTQAPVAALWERMFYAGRYHFISSSSELTPPDLLGIWTGDCRAGWSGYYHLDANLNLQVSGGNIGAMPEAMEGYYHLNEVWRPDFKTNARRLLDCRGMLACGNTPGLASGLMASINTFYPYHYATGEMAWLLYPFWEHWLVTEDREFLVNRLFPMLVEMGEFYEDFLFCRDGSGRYILAGSVSPENQPANLGVSLLNNSAFDVAGARFLLGVLVKSCRLLGKELGEGGRCAKWFRMLAELPDYRINADGALQEWGWDGLTDNYDHRHLSHLMAVWPYRELNAETTPALYGAARRALQKRDEHPYSNAGHGYLHAALIAATLHDAGSLMGKMDNLTRRNFYYSSLATAHYPDYGTFCMDVGHTMPTILTEMLVGSDEQGIDLLPALVTGLPRGEISGVRTRCGITVERMSWDTHAGTVILTLRAHRSKTVRIKAPYGYDAPVTLKAGKPLTLRIPLAAK